MKKRAWKDAREDYIVEQAVIMKIVWRLVVAITLLGLGYRFFGAKCE